MPNKKNTCFPWPFLLRGFIPHSFHHFSPMFFFRGEPWLSRVGDSLEPLQAIGFSPPPREAAPPIFFGRNFGGLVKIHPQKKNLSGKKIECWIFCWVWSSYLSELYSCWLWIHIFFHVIWLVRTIPNQLLILLVIEYLLITKHQPVQKKHLQCQTFAGHFLVGRMVNAQLRALICSDRASVRAPAAASCFSKSAMMLRRSWVAPRWWSGVHSLQLTVRP